MIGPGWLWPAVTDPAVTDPSVQRTRALGRRGGEDLPDASPAMQDVFRSADDIARALFDLRPAAEQATSAARDTPEAARPGEEARADESGPVKHAVTGRHPRVRPTTRTAFQVATGSVLAVVGGELLSPQRWYWAVFTCWVVFISTTSTGEILVRGARRLIGTASGAVAGLALAAWVGDAPWPAFALACLSVFGMYYTSAVSYTLMSFFVTTMIGMLYALLHALSPGVPVVRIEETARGIACGLAGALFVLPVRTSDHTDRLLRDVRERLRAVLSRSVARLGGESGGDLLVPARALDSALDEPRLSAQPLIIPFTPLRSRRRTALAVLGPLATAAFHARSVALTAARLPVGVLGGTAPRIADETGRIDRDLAALIGGVAASGGDGTADERGPGIPAGLGASESGAGGEDVDATRRTARHLQRLDDSVRTLARTLDLSVGPGA